MSATKRLAEQAGVIPADNRPADYDAREEATIRYLIELDREAEIRAAFLRAWERWLGEAIGPHDSPADSDTGPLGYEARF